MSEGGAQFMAISSGQVNHTELVAALINQKDDLVEGIVLRRRPFEGSLTLLVMTEDGVVYAARDRMGRFPVLIGRDIEGQGYCISFESFVYQKLGYEDGVRAGARRDRGRPRRRHGYESLAAPRDKMKICAFLWVYYGYPNSNYEGMNVEVMRYRHADHGPRRTRAGCMPQVDYVAGVPDSGVPHAIGYATESGMPFGRPFIKYTPTWPRSFMPANQDLRNKIANMKQVPVPELIRDKKLLFVDDSIVRGTQLGKTVNFLYERRRARGAHALRLPADHVQLQVPELLARASRTGPHRAAASYTSWRATRASSTCDEYADSSTERGQCLLRKICEELGFDSLGYQSLQGMLEAIGIDPEQVCTYCWDGRSSSLAARLV